MIGNKKIASLASLSPKRETTPSVNFNYGGLNEKTYHSHLGYYHYVWL